MLPIRQWAQKLYVWGLCPPSRYARRVSTQYFDVCWPMCLGEEGGPLATAEALRVNDSLLFFLAPARLQVGQTLHARVQTSTTRGLECGLRIVRVRAWPLAAPVYVALMVAFAEGDRRTLQEALFALREQEWRAQDRAQARCRR